MNSPQKIPVIIAVGDFASGVTSWALRLRAAFADHGRYTVLLMNCADTGNKIGAFDLHATTQTQARALLSAYDEAVVAPNFVWDLFPICASLNADGHRLWCIGFCRADSEQEYYAPLRWYAPVISQFAAVSPACATNLAAALDVSADTIHVLPSGIWVPESLDRTYQTAPLRMAYGGRIVQAQKRVLDFVPLVRALYELGVDFRFDIAGAGRQLEELRRGIETVDPENRVRFVGRKTPEAMAAFWAEHDVFVQVSEFEGTSNSMLESMAAGTVPFITETASGVDGIVADGRNGRLVPVGDMATLARALAEVAGDRAILAAMGAAAHTAVKPFAMANYVEKFTRLLDAARVAAPGIWPEGQSISPPAPFFGIRLAPPAEEGAKKGRIAILFPSPIRGGAEEYTLTVAAGAARAGYDVQGAFSGRSSLHGLSRDYFAAGAFHHTLEICDVGAKSGQAPVYKRFTRTVRLLLRLRPKAALYTLCGMQYGFMSLLGCALLRVPTLVVFQLVRDDVRFSPLRRVIYRWMRRRGQRYAAVSRNSRGVLARAFRMPVEDILVIPNGVDLARFDFGADDRARARRQLREALGLGPDTAICLTVGRLSHQKGHDVLIPAIPHILARRPEVHFVWAGDGPLEKKLRGQLATYGVANHVTLLGHRQDIPQLLLAADLFVHPTRFEGQPFSLLEAMAAGVPVVSTHASGIREVAADGEHGILCRPDDIAALREGILRALDAPEAAAAMAEAARERVAAFSTAAMVGATLAALDTLADSR